MARQDKPVVISFRADQHLAELLSGLPDKSSFIRQAILNQFYQACPLCNGKGVVPEEIAKWASKTLDAEKAVYCECCDYKFPASATDGKSGKKFVCEHCRDHDHRH